MKLLNMCCVLEYLSYANKLSDFRHIKDQKKTKTVNKVSPNQRFKLPNEVAAHLLVRLGRSLPPVSLNSLNCARHEGI